MIGHDEKNGAIGLRRAQITGDLSLSGAKLVNEIGSALRAEQVRVGGNLRLDKEFSATGQGDDGAVFLPRACITGALFLSSAEITNRTGPALNGFNLQIEGGLFLDDGFRVIGHHRAGVVILIGARIVGELSSQRVELTNSKGCAINLAWAHISKDISLSGAKLTSEDGPALLGANLQADSGLYLDSVRVTGYSKNSGAVELWRANIRRNLYLSSAELVNNTGHALAGYQLQVGRDLYLDDGFQATGHGEGGAVNLTEARITGDLSLSGAQLDCGNGAALIAAQLQVGGNSYLDKGFRASGNSKDYGTVELRRAHITGNLFLSGAELENDAGPALSCFQLQVDCNLVLDKGFQATGQGKNGAVSLEEARITDDLSLSGAQLRNDGGTALIGYRLEVGDNLFLSEGFQATGHGEDNTIILEQARIRNFCLQNAELAHPTKGRLLDLRGADTKEVSLSGRVICPQEVEWPKRCEPTTPKNLINLPDFTYGSLGDVTNWKQWLHLITCHTSGHQPQPFQQLASVQSAAGKQDDARKINIAAYRDRRQRGNLGRWPIKTGYLLWGIFAGYGYRTGRLALSLLIILLVAAGLGVAAAHISTGPGRYVAMRTTQAGDLVGRCSPAEQIGVGLDHSLPVGNVGIHNRCDFDTTSGWGQVITGFTWFLQLLIWGLATLFIAGYGELIRKVT